MTRKIGLPTILAVAVLGVILVRAVAAGDAAQPGPSKMTTVVLRVQGMESAVCEIGVKTALGSLDGVKGVTVDRDGGRAEVSIDPAVVSPAALVEAVLAIGFEASLPDGGGGRAAAVAAAVDGPQAHAAPATLTPEQIERVAAFVAEKVIAKEEVPTSPEVIQAATGVHVSQADRPALQRAVMEKLARDPRGQEMLAGSRCTDYGACSIWGNLATATGDILALYEREKASDGATFESLALPAFEARNLAGEKVRSRDLVGRPAVLAFLAVHCNHSMDTFPILQELHRRYAKQGLQVVGVLVNSGSVRDANSWLPHFAPEYPIWVYETESLGDLIGSHLVPTHLLIDERGRVRKKLVGFKDEQTLLGNLKLIQSPGQT